MGKIIITVGDMTTHGGAVLVGDPTIVIEGKPVARIGSTIVCPLCKIPTVIVQGATMATRPVAGRNSSAPGPNRPAPSKSATTSTSAPA